MTTPETTDPEVLAAAREARIVSWFSCGAASAVATKLAIQSARGREVVVAYCDTFKREHPDNRRFFADCQRWSSIEIEDCDAVESEAA